LIFAITSYLSSLCSLALAIGIVVGSTALKPGVTNRLNNATSAEAKANNVLYAHNQQLKDEIGADQAFAQAAEGSLLRGLLVGQHVVLVVAPGADSPTVDGVTTALQKSGAVVTGQVVLSQQFFDTGSVNEQGLKSTATTATRVLPPGIALPNSAADQQTSGQQAAAQVITAAIVNKDGVGTVTAKASQKVLNEFGNANFLQVNDGNGNPVLTGQATMAVVLLPATAPPATTSGPINLALISPGARPSAGQQGRLAGRVAQGVRSAQCHRRRHRRRCRGTAHDSRQC